MVSTMKQRQARPSSGENTIFDFDPDEIYVEETERAALALAPRFKEALTALERAPKYQPFFEPTDDELLLLPFAKIRLNEHLFDVPKRKGKREDAAEATARLLYPMHSQSLSSLIRYEQDRVRIRQWIILQRRYDILAATRRHAEHEWKQRVRKQGPWDPEKQPIPLTGPPGLPMPVDISDADSLHPFFRHLQHGGTSEPTSADDRFPFKSVTEEFYDTKALEFPKGVLYEDRRMDLCKMVVGPTHIGKLMEALRPNTFVKHYLLGNNIIGNIGAKEIASFVNEHPDRIDTWYLAGNAIHGEGFTQLVDALVKSPAVTNIWLKRNPLGFNGASPITDLFRLITETKNLRTLDLDQTEIGEAGVTELFNKLHDHATPICLENLYLNGNGVSVDACKAIAKYISSSHCNIKSLYLSNNPIGNKGAAALAHGLLTNRTILRLSVQSIGLSDLGAINLFDALNNHPTLRVLDVGHSFATEDLGQAYNYLTDAVASSLANMILPTFKLEYLNLGTCGLTNEGLNMILRAAKDSHSLLYCNASPLQRQGDDWISIKLGQERSRLTKLVQDRLLANVKAKHGTDMTYDQWNTSEKRWVISDREDVRKIDSVYRNRDMAMARRGEKKLVKWWDENDQTLNEVMGVAVGPMCLKKQSKKGSAGVVV